MPVPARKLVTAGPYVQLNVNAVVLWIDFNTITTTVLYVEHNLKKGYDKQVNITLMINSFVWWLYRTAS